MNPGRENSHARKAAIALRRFLDEDPQALLLTSLELDYMHLSMDRLFEIHNRSAS